MAEHQPTVYRIFCLALGQTIPFSISTWSNATVDDLKAAINAKQKLVEIEKADDLALYLINIPYDENLEEKVNGLLNVEPVPDELEGTKELNDPFPKAPAKGIVHILVNAPESGPRSLKRKVRFESESGAKRHRNLADFDGEAILIQFGKKPEPEIIPLSILHPIFAQFMEEVNTYEPTAADYGLMRELRGLLKTAHKSEFSYCDYIRELLETHYKDARLDASRVKITPYISETRLGVDEFISSVRAQKVQSLPSDMEGEAVGYIVTSIPDSLKNTEGCPDKFPCMIMYIFGSFICFAGAVLIKRVHLETFTPAFPIHANYHEAKVAKQAARALGAFRRAIEGFHTYYTESALKKDDPSTDTDESNDKLPYPYKCHYFSKTGERVDFEYIARLHDKMLFLCEDTSEEYLCVKFTKKYSVEAHQYCADQGVAPELYAVDYLPGGWIMVVMEWMDYETHKLLYQWEGDRAAITPEIQRVVGLLHQGDFVHGDIRNGNFLVRKDWKTTSEKRKVLLIDFDWAGPKDSTRYPPHVNTEIYRPDGATDGQLITQDHDLDMLNHIFE